MGLDTRPAAQLPQQLSLGTTLGPHAMHATEQPARRLTQRQAVTPSTTSQNG